MNVDQDNGIYLYTPLIQDLKSDSDEQSFSLFMSPNSAFANYV